MSLFHIFILSMLVIVPVAFMFFFYTGFRGDPSKGRKRCRKCWHSMEGLPKGEKGWTCPECGTLARTEKHLYKRRRYRWRIAVCATILVVGALVPYGFIVADRWEDEGYAALIPTTALAIAYSRDFDSLLDEESLGFKVDEMLRQRSYDTWDWQIAMIREPRLEHDTPDPASLVEFPEVWVAGEPVAVRLTVENWSRGRTRVGTCIIGEAFEEGASDNCVSAYASLLVDDPNDWTRRTGWVYLKPVTEERPTHDVRAQCVLIARGLAKETRLDYFAPLSMPAPRFVSMEEALAGAVTAPASDPAIDAWLLKQDWFGLLIMLRGGFVAYTAVWGPDNFADYENYLNDAPLDINVRAEIWDGDERLVSTVLRQDWSLNRSAPIDELHEGEGDLFRRLFGATDEEGAANMQRMTVRLVPVPELALQPPEHSRYWVPAGGAPYLELPLREALAIGTEWVDPASPRASRIRATLPATP